MDIVATTSVAMGLPSRHLDRATLPHRFRLQWLILLAAFGVFLCIAAQASVPTQPNASVIVSNGDFSNPANDGSIGGGVVGGSGGGPIGSGPWAGSYNGIAALLAPPTLTIGAGKAQIGGLLGVNAVGILNNNGRFRLNTGIAWQPNRRYVLEADIDASSVLTANVLLGGNVGIAISTDISKASRVVSSTSGTATLSLLSGTTYRVSVEYVTGASVSGNIFVQLFGEPNGLLGVNLLSAVSFDNVTLHTYLLTQTPTTIVPANPGPYTGTVGGVVDPDIGVVVLDSIGDPIPGVTVTFTVPASGPSAVVTPNPATTGADGIAHVTTTANTIAGDYDITATVSGIGTPFVYHMTNLAGPPAQVGGVSGGGQNATAGSPFSAPVGLQVLDQYDNPVAGVQVTFIPPSSGASSSFAPNPATTDANGQISVTATANTIAGTYDVEVSVSGVSPSTNFQLTNTAGPAAQLGNASGGGQGAEVGSSFTNPVGLQVQDQYGNGVSGVTVTFSSPPPSQASSTFTPNPAVSDANGMVSVAAQANTIAGTYDVEASISGVPTPMTFELTNQAGPAASIGSLSGSGQGAVTNTPFASLLGLQVLDQYANPVASVMVTFTPPSSGPSAVVNPVTVMSGPGGLVSTTATANGIAGEYSIDVSVAGLGSVAQIDLTNMLDPTIGVDDVGESHQNTSIDAPFSCVLLVQIVDGTGTPMPGLAVDFDAPASGASAMLANDSSSGTHMQVNSDVDGFAWVEATANGIEGSFIVAAQLKYSLAPVKEFHLKNLAANDPIMGNGFDGICIPFAATLEVPADSGK
ncbi:MAG TPA: Ig-like domain-containing protein [Dokdonella sp.]|uniref:Ig-like domain-containing protein n=1 Tax=Dokdonella sp. TaxID=2291710 RepID=UPI002D7F7A34|nr:Ig-like domain-containing protein [Dokdonella sp.]HET9034196.1 Ig-like domain-containing protein [Dokdonella sp.]